MYEMGDEGMSAIDIKATTFSGGGIFYIPIIEVECDDFFYSSTTPDLHGIQVSERLLDKEAAIKKHCDKIYDELSELYKIINL